MNAPSNNPAATIAADMRRLDAATRRAVRPKLRAAGDMVAAAARANASWSTRIPGTVRVQTSFRADREGVQVIVGGPNAPHARPYEDVLRKGKFRHPVYPDAENLMRKRWTWVEQASRPFLFPAATSNAGASLQLVQTALAEAARDLGFEGT